MSFSRTLGGGPKLGYLVRTTGEPGCYEVRPRLRA